MGKRRKRKVVGGEWRGSGSTCESSCVLVYFNGRDSFVHLASYCFSVLAFCCFILYVLPYGVINNNNNNKVTFATTCMLVDAALLGCEILV